MGTDVRAFTRSGTLIGFVSWSTMSRQVEHNGPGTLTFDAPLSERGNATIIAADEPYLRVYEGGVEQPDWYMLDDDGDNLADAGGTARPVSIAARGVRCLLEWAVVYPQAYVPGGQVAGLDPSWVFASATPGKIMLDLINAAKARGAIPQISVNFTATTDSSGNPWASVYSITYSAGTDLLEVLDKMCDAGWCDSRMVGLQLRLYNLDTTLAVDKPGSVLRNGQGVTDGPRKRTRRAIYSTLLGVGDEGAMVEVTSAPALGKYGRREGFEGRSGITDLGTLSAVTQESLNKQSDASESVTVVIDPAAPGQPVPMTDFLPGYYIRYDRRRLNDSTLEPMRVQSIAWAIDSSGPHISIELNDMWVDAQTRLTRRITALTGGSSANERVPQPTPPTDDTVAPLAPASVTVTPSVYYPQRNALLPTRAAVAAATISWPTVLLNTDGTDYKDAGSYIVSILLPSRSGTGWSAEQIARTNSTFISGFTFGEALQARVATQDSSGNRSDWTYSPSVTLTGGTPGPIPQAPDPFLETRMGQVWATWNGVDRTGAQLDPWVVGAEVHTSATAGFTVSDATRQDLLGTQGTSVVPGRQLGVPTYVRLVLVDYLGNRGTPSNAVSVTATQFVSADIFDGAIGSAKLADLVVTTAKIANLAVNDAKIASVSAGKITTGTLIADVLLGAQIRTATSGARVVVSNLGIQEFNALNQTVVNLDTSGNATFSGSVTTAEVTNYVRAISGASQIVINPHGVQWPDGTLAPMLILSNGGTAERSSGGLYTYQEVLDANRKWVHAMLRTPGAYVPLTGSTNEQYSYVQVSTVGRSTPYTVDTQVPAKVTIGLASRNSVFFVANLSTDTSASASNPGMVLNGPTPAGIRNSAGFLDAVNDTGSGYVTMRAASFAAQSNERIKTDIADVDLDVLDVLRANPAKQWRYRPEHADSSRLRLGPMADRLPDHMVERDGDDTFTDLHSGLGFLWKVAEVLLDRVERKAVA
jgi:hypothetical protein